MPVFLHLVASCFHVPHGFLYSFFRREIPKRNLQFSSVTGWGVDPTSTGYVWICLVDLVSILGLSGYHDEQYEQSPTASWWEDFCLIHVFCHTGNQRFFVFFYHRGLMVIYHGRRLKRHLTPRKINMEHNHGGLEDHFPF